MLVTASVWQFVKVWLGVIWSYLWRGGYNITCNYFGTLHLGRGEKIFKSLWLYMIFGVKHFCVHFIYCFMLLVKGVRLDWLVFHMISFLLMHILQGYILTFDERQPLMEESLWWKTTFDGRLPSKAFFHWGLSLNKGQNTSLKNVHQKKDNHMKNQSVQPNPLN